jgi:2-hydroxychromene-2-carboxylate isomerase
MKTVEFFFDFASATSYLAYTQLPKIAAAHNAEIIWRPMLLGAVFKATGTVSPVTVAAKGRWMFGDLQLWGERYGVPFKPTPHFPVNSLTALRGAVAMQMRMPKEFRRYMDLIFRAIWEFHRDFNQQDAIAAVLREAGFDIDRMLSLVSDPAVKQQLKSNTDEAVARGVFGAPTFFVAGQMFFGQDRLEFVAEALDRATEPIAER